MREILPGSVTTTHEVDLGPASGGQGRNVFVFIDGTWNEERSADGDGALSNVRKLYDCLGADSPTQIARYFRGVGNRQDNAPLMKRWRAFNGSDEPRIRRAAHATINKEYQPGDRLFVIGFSRGAACARRLAADLHECGIHQRIEIDTSYAANRLTRHVESRITRWRGSGECRPLPVSFLGCWDTVGAFVLPLRFPGVPILDALVRRFVNLRQRLQGVVPFRNLRISEGVGRAVHCVAIDETRNAFLPTLMEDDPRVEEVWFPGVHADVGGGYTRDGLARCTLAFMINRIDHWVASAGLRSVQWDAEAIARHAGIDADNDLDFHFHGLGPIGRRIRRIRVRRGATGSGTRKPRLHWSVAELWQSDRVHAQPRPGRRFKLEYRPYNIFELNDRRPPGASAEEWPFEWVDRPPGAHV